MSSKTKSISDLAIELQQENENLQSIKKQYMRIVNQVCKEEFGYDAKTVHELLDKQKMYEQRKAERQGQQPTFSHSEM